jgi:hypothetical protein
MASSEGWPSLIENDTQLALTRQRVAELHALLLEMKRQVPYPEYREMAEAFLADIRRMQEEMHEYLLSAPPREQVAS